jgi:transcriptional regulator with XRE-family HTH domain
MRKNRLKEIRIKNHLTQEELAEKLHTDKVQISRWENGKAIPRSEALIELSAILGVSVDYLLGLSDEPTIRIRVDNLSLEEMAILSALRSGNDKEAMKIIANR